MNFETTITYIGSQIKKVFPDYPNPINLSILHKLLNSTRYSAVALTLSSFQVQVLLKCRRIQKGAEDREPLQDRRWCGVQHQTKGPQVVQKR